MKTEPFSRRNLLKMGWKTSLGLLGAAALTSVYSFVGERFWYELQEVRVSFSRLPHEFSGMRVVHISDLHLGHFYDADDLINVAEMIQSLNPDMICMTGDLIEEDGSELERAVPILRQLDAPLGKWAVLGNHDYRGSVLKVTEALTSSAFHLLKNSHLPVEWKGQRIYLAGLDDALNGIPDIEEAIQGIPNGSFTMLLVHEPDFADISRDYPVDFQLSGHSHGGQIRIPFLGPVFTPIGARNYVHGLRRFPPSDMQLYVNRGIGTTFLPLRFSCRPEITLFTFYSRKNKV